MKKRYTLGVALATTLLGASCSWITPAPGAESIEVRMSTEVGDCKYLGRATAQTRATIGVNRNEETVQSELLLLARNEAVTMDGNTVVANDKPLAGRQSFSVYDCP